MPTISRTDAFAKRKRKLDNGESVSGPVHKPLTGAGSSGHGPDAKHSVNSTSAGSQRRGSTGGDMSTPHLRHVAPHSNEASAVHGTQRRHRNLSERMPSSGARWRASFPATLQHVIGLNVRLIRGGNDHPMNRKNSESANHASHHPPGPSRGELSSSKLNV